MIFIIIMENKLIQEANMKKLTQCEKGSRCKVAKIYATGPLKQRLISFGMMKGVVVELLEYSPTKSTIEVKVGKMRIALRKEEAELIEIEDHE